MKRSIFTMLASWVAALGAALVLGACGGGPPGPKPIPPPPPPPAPTVTRGDWYTYRHDSQRTARSGKIGPQAPQVLWSVPGSGEAVFDSEGTAYLYCMEEQEAIYGGLAAVVDGEVEWMLDTEAEGEPVGCTVGNDGSLYAGLWRPWTIAPETANRYGHDHSLMWTYELNSVGAPTLLANGNCCFLGSLLDSLDYSIICLNSSGALLWDTPVDVFVDVSMVFAVAPDSGILGTTGMGLDGDADDATLFKLDATNGAVLWETGVAVREDYWGSMPSFPVVCADGGIVVVDSLAVNKLASDGQHEWSYYPAGEDLDNLQGPSPWGEGWPSALGPEGNIYVLLMEEVETYATALIALSPQGELLWRRDEHFEGAPIVDAAGTIYLGSGYGEPGAFIFGVSQADPMQPRNSILAINPDGSTKWEFSAPGELEVGTVWCMDNEGNLVVSGRIPGGDPWDERLFWLGDG